MIDINNIIKGLFIGIGKIIPGVSGSLIALNLGIYEKLINSISDFFKNIKNNILFLGNVGIGLVISIIFGSKVINHLYTNYNFITMMLFLGLIIGTLKEVLCKVTLKNKKQIHCILISFLLLTILCCFKVNNKFNYNNFSIILLGIIEAITMIIPGISGTAIYILLGCYDFFLNLFSNPFDNINHLILFIAGLLFGIIMTTKIMNYLLNNKKNIIYPIILGFSLSSIFILIVKTISNYNGHLVIGVVLFLLGYKISYKYI